MKTEKNILIAFILNLAFSVFEFLGGIFTGSVAIISDAVHDVGDAASIGISFFLERKSNRKPDKKYTYGYVGYSVIGGFITTLILFIGSLAIIYNSISKIITPTPINYNGMIIFAIIGILVNFTAAILTHKGHSINQKAVNLHMLEDVLGWIVVLIGAIIMNFTNLYIIDPIMSIGVAIFILINSIKNLKEVLELLLNKTPHNIDINDLKKHIYEIQGITGVHHIHVWSIDGYNNYATMHIVTNENQYVIKKKVREKLNEHGIFHATLELEDDNEICANKECNLNFATKSKEHHHRH